MKNKVVATILSLLAFVLVVSCAKANDFEFIDARGRYTTDNVKKKVDYKTFFTQSQIAPGTDEDTRAILEQKGYKFSSAADAGLAGRIFSNELVNNEIIKIKLNGDAEVATKAGSHPYLMGCKVKVVGVFKYRPNRLKPDAEPEPMEMEEEPIRIRPTPRPTLRPQPTPTPEPVQTQVSPCLICPTVEVTKTWATKTERFFGDVTGKLLSAGAGAGAGAALSTDGNRKKGAIRSAVVSAGASTAWNIIDPNHNRAKVVVNFFDDEENYRPVERELKRGDSIEVEGVVVKWEKRKWWKDEKIVFINTNPRCQKYTERVNRKMHLTPIPIPSRGVKAIKTQPSRSVPTRPEGAYSLGTVAPRRNPNLPGSFPPAQVRQLGAVNGGTLRAGDRIILP